ncbi:MAG: hypothetical protein ABII09_07095 [Planctomycetota bacterium]
MMLLARSSLLIVCSSLLMLVFAAGCENANAPGKASLSQQVEQLSKEKSELEIRLEQSQAETEGLKKQMEALAGLPGEKRASAIYSLKAVKIGRYTNLYDEDKNGTKETLIVYIQPIDETGDAIKAAGAIDVQLWDLSKPSAEALLGKWSVEPNELRELWFDSIALTGYRLKYDVGALIGKSANPLTVKVAFTDYLSGKVFTEQKTIKP